MNLHEFLKLLRTRWVTLCVAALVTILAGTAYALLQTPLYQATTRLFVSTASGASAVDLYQGNRYSQDRVLSYTELLKGETLANRVIDRLGLTMTANKLQKKVTAKSTPNTVLITVSVLDDSPVRARDIANTLSDEFVVMVRELETPRAGAAPDARVTVEQKATIPDKPSIPNKILNFAMSTILGVLLGVVFAILRDQLDNTIKRQEDLEEITGAGVVGYIPFDKKIPTTPAINFDADNSVTAESFRKLRTNLHFLAVDNPPRVIVVTSALPGEGKTTNAIEIALALAEADHNVVLVDGDLRRSRVARYLDLVESVGVSTLLSGAATLDEVLQTSKYPRLTVLAAGPTPPNPSELLGSLATKKLLNDLRARFDYVVIDSSPLLAVTDGAILAANADGALLIARYGKTKRDQLAHASGIIADVGATLLGSVLSMMPTRGNDSYSYGHYSYSSRDEKGPKSGVNDFPKISGLANPQDV